VTGSSRESGPLARLPRRTQWGVLLVLSAALAALLAWIGIPAALFLGPMIAGILFGADGATLRVPRLPYTAAQAILGCLIARAMSAGIGGAFMRQWPLFVAIVLAVIAAATGLGWIMTRMRVLPGTTAIWGVSPGAATTMMLMAEAYGADVQLVAFMQFSRVVFVAGAASLVARIWLHATAGTPPAIVWFAPIDWLPFGETLALAAVGGFIGRWSRIPAGAMLVPAAVGAALHISGLMQIDLPQWLLAISYALLGWHIGLGFTRRILAHASRALPQILLSIIVLVAFCCALAFLLVKLLGVDPLTAYLATSPGGLDSVAIIAAASKVDLSFVMALQTARLLIVMLIGPRLARLIAGRTERTAAAARPER
jgi:membrane AbrB-like protein